MPFRTVAGLILRPDGTYFAQVAPRESLDEVHYVSDDHTSGLRDGMEVAGYFQGISGNWSVQTGEPSLLHLERRSLNDGSPLAGSAPDLALEFEVRGKDLIVTNQRYAGSQNGKSDTLHRRNDDCRLKRIERTAAESEIDQIEAEVLGIGTSLNEPLRFEKDLVGEVAMDADARCKKAVIESSLRSVWRDGRTGAIRAIGLVWSDIGDPVVEHAQTYLYDTEGLLRLIVTVSQSSEDDVGGLRVVQHRTYIDSAGRTIRTLVQPYLEQTDLQTANGVLTGRRYQGLQYPFSVVDMPVCEAPAGSTPPLLAHSPNDPQRSLDAPTVCRD